jgi:1-acyl-sn-glycerol-3-phosphate acyltransferase
MAINAGVYIVPVACSGAHRVMEKGSLQLTPGKILVEFLDPIDASKYTIARRDELNRKVHDALAAGLPADQRPADFAAAAGGQRSSNSVAAETA